MPLPDKISKVILTKKPVYSVFDKIVLGKGSKYINIYRVSTNNIEYKLLELSKHGLNSEKYRNSFLSYCDKARAFNGSNSFPNVVYSDNDTLLLDWVKGKTLDTVNIDEDLIKKIACSCASVMQEIKKIDINSFVDDSYFKLENLKKRNLLLSNDVTKIKKIFDNKIDIPLYEYEGLGFSDAALKNYLLSPDGKVIYIDVYGLNRTRISHNLLRHMYFFPDKYRKIFFLEYSKYKTQFISTEHLPFYYVNYLIRIANSKSINFRRFNKANRMKKALNAIKRLKEFVKYHDDDLLTNDYIYEGQMYK